MKNILFNVFIAGTVALATLGTSLGQTAPTLGTAANFALFTSAGDFGNTGTTIVTGDIGYGTGSVSGNPVTLTGSAHFGDGAGTQAAFDVASAYSQLSNVVTYSCGTTLTTPIGVGGTLTKGVYCSTTATVLTGDLTLDAESDPNAVFIIKIGGALSVTAPVNIILTNGAQLKNVYWQVNGAVSLDAGAAFKGTVINAGAISLAAGASISGRALSTVGLISLNNNVVSNTEASLPVTLVSFTIRSGENQSALLEWATTEETNSDRFEIEHSITGKNWKKIATVASNGESRELISYSYSDLTPVEGINLYRLKMIDRDETFAYSRIRNINIESGSKTILYPNPASDQLTLEVNDLSKIERIEFNNLAGKSVLDQKKASSSNMSFDFNIHGFPAGLYFVRVTHTNGSVDLLKIVKR
jgi:hypothetical protein